MSPTILIVGATGNTGRGVVSTLPKLLATSNAVSNHRVIALTRSLNGKVAQQLARIPGVEVVEQNWVEITADWLREHEVERAFIAPHNKPNQFAEESAFHLTALQAGVKYVVRISTAARNVRPDCATYYARSHWAIEALLSAPEFSNLQWTSLQPNAFGSFYLYGATEFIKQYRKTGKQDVLRLMAAKDAPVGIIDPDEIGVFAAHLLAQDDVSVHNKAKYILNGPEDVTGDQIVKMVEQYIGVQVERVSYKDMSPLDSYIESEYLGNDQPKNIVWSIKRALEPMWEGKSTASTTSKEVLEIAAPKRTPAQILQALLE
ncbi:NmrA-like family protein [Aspergillus lucknowensis]|uniref:NmrA-like domain-containing protein n=1 Tax=Aspergillus lucknowensis TaxID=176173 RepID=A0ABR4LPH4_9EURO